MHTRPTTGRIKETLFNIIQADVPDSRFLDLYSGSGSIAIEALSRGAKEAVLVDNNKEAFMCINQNIQKTHFNAIAQVVFAEVMSALKDLMALAGFLILYLWTRRMAEALKRMHWAFC